MSTESDTSNTIQATTFVTTRDPHKPPTPGPDDPNHPSNTGEQKEEKEEKEAKTPEEKDPADKPPTPGPDDPNHPSNTKDPSQKPPTPEPDTTPYINTTTVYFPSQDPNGSEYDSTLAPWSTLFEEDPPTSYPTMKPPKPPAETKDPNDKPPTPGPDDPIPPPRPSDDPFNTNGPYIYPPPPDDTKDPNDRPPTPGPGEDKPPKDDSGESSDGAGGAKEDKGHAADTAADLLTYKQSLGVASIILIIALIIFALLQIRIHRNKSCYKNFKKGQWSNYAGKTLFIIFVIATVMFLINAIVFCYFILHFNTIIESEYETVYTMTNIFSMVPYRIGKLFMSLFFILRLHFVFKDAALRINKWIIYSLIIFATIGTILGCIAGITGPLKVLAPIMINGKELNANLFMSFISLGILIVVDIIVMYFYNQRLRAIVIMQGEVSRRSTITYRRSTVTTRSGRIRANTASTFAASIASKFAGAGRIKSITAASNHSTEVVELSPDLKGQKSSTWTRGNSVNLNINDGDENEGNNTLNRITSNSTNHLAVTTPITPITPTPQFNKFPSNDDGDGDPLTEYPRDNSMNMSMEMNGDGDGEWENEDGDGDTPEDEEDEYEDEMVEITETEVHIDRNLVRTITKSTLLSVIGITTSFWIHIEMIVMAARGTSDGVMLRALGSIDGGINVICMYLVFAFAKPYYDIGCKMCHWGMSKCCKFAARRAVVRAKSTTDTELSNI